MNLLKASGAFAVGLAMTVSASSSVTNGATEIAIKDRANSNASVAARGRFVALAWSASTNEGVTDIFFTASRDGGRAFATPTRVNDVPGEARVSGEQPPRIALVPSAGRDPSIVVAWTAKGSTGTRLLSARSNDGGRSFSSAAPVVGTDASGNRGWESVAASQDGAVVALWLDHREASTSASGAPMNHARHQHDAASRNPTDSVVRAQLSKLFFARLGEPGSAHAVTGGVCYCCKTALATDADGVIFAAWRHVYEGNIRDIAFSRSSDAGRTFTPPVRVSQDDWVIHGCPENGPALAVDANHRIHVVWPTLVPGSTSASEPTLGLFYAMSEDGRHFTARQRIPTDGVARHPQIAAGPRGDVIVVWDQQSNGTRRIALARAIVHRDGTASFVTQPIGDAAAAAYPIVAPVEDGAIVAWTSGSMGQTVIRAQRLAN
jgi:hypothetical protein